MICLINFLFFDKYCKVNYNKCITMEGEDMIKAIEDVLKQSESLPFLFIGSGISRRYLDMPDWEGLLKLLSEFISKNSYQKYLNKADYSLPSNYTYNDKMSTIADYIQMDINNIWYDRNEFKKTRDLYAEEISKGISPLKIEIANYVKTLSSDPNKYLLKNEVEAMKKISERSIAGIITTNYDLFLETIFDFKRYVGQEELMFSTSYGFGEIYKIHGCCTKPESIIINSRDYEKIHNSNQYLAAKLLTIFVENPIIFMGYSINDADIQEIIKSLIICSGDKIKSVENKFIFIERNTTVETYIESEYSMNFSDINKSINMKKIQLNDYSFLYDTLSNNKSKYPVKALRRIKKDIYELVLSNDKNNKLVVLADDKAFNDESNDIEYVVGFGISSLGKRGYSYITQIEIFEDILFNNGNFNNILLVKHTIPKLIRDTSGSLPIYKYIKDMDPNELDSKITENMKDEFSQFQSGSLLKNTKLKEINIKSICEEESYNIEKRLKFISCLKEEQIVLDDLEKFLIDTLRNNPDYLNSGKGKTDIKRLIKMYDWLKYYRK